MDLPHLSGGTQLDNVADMVSKGRVQSGPYKGEEGLYTTSEVAKLFRVDPKTVKRWVALGKLKATKTPGGHFRFEESHIKDKLRETR